MCFCIVVNWFIVFRVDMMHNREENCLFLKDMVLNNVKTKTGMGDFILC